MFTAVLTATAKFRRKLCKPEVQQPSFVTIQFFKHIQPRTQPTEDHKQNRKDNSSFINLWSHFWTNAWLLDPIPGGQCQRREKSGQWGEYFLFPVCGSGLSSSSFFNLPIFSLEEKGKEREFETYRKQYPPNRIDINRNIYYFLLSACFVLIFNFSWFKGELRLSICYFSFFLI